MNKEELKSKIIKANAAYRSGAAMMSDIEYDSMLEQFKSLVSEDEYLEFTSSLNEGAIETGEKVKHPFIMGSLSKLKYETPAEVKEFIDKHCPCLIASAKVDGISCRLHYENGQLTSASTRGDGYEGISLTDKIKFVKCVPKVLGTGKFRDEYKSIDIRGELVIFKDDFAKMSGFANARNACAGIMNRKDWNADDVSKITFVAYTILGDKFTKEAQFAYLNSWGGFCVAWNKQFRTYEFLYKSADEVAKTMFEYASQEFEYETDGLVLCNATYRNEDKYRPDECKAFKINQQIGETKLVDVAWEGPSKDGFMCPVGIVDPIELGGATISRVTLHNLDIIDELGLMYGSKVLLKRSGDVIPCIVKVISNDSTCSNIEMPAECPCCGSTLVRDGVNLRCMNKDCADQVVHRLALFIKKLGVKSASDATLKNFGLTSFEKLMSFAPDKKYKSKVKLFDELYSKVFSQSKETLLGAMNFVGLSETLIGKIVSHYGYGMVSSSSFADEAFKSLPDGIGELTLQKFIDGLPEALAQVNMVINDTRWHFIEGAQASSRMNAVCKGSICVTGSLKFGSRDKFLEFAKAHGYEAKSGVSKGLTYLVNNDINSNSSKNRKAKTLGIQIITEESFMKMLNDSNVEQSLDSI